MTKLLVVHEQSGGRVPFLRGILVQSLVNAGLPFADAYAIAREVRASLSRVAEVSSADLRSMVATLLGKRFGAETREAFLGKGPAPVLVRTRTREAAFSVGILSRSLEGMAIDRDQALETARRVQETLQAAPDRVTDHLALRRLVHRSLVDLGWAEYAQRYLSWCGFQRSDTPLLLLLGGASGTGKSTVAAELAYRLQIVRSQSTDLLREIVRSVVPQGTAPALDYSSFEAWRAIAPERPATGRGRKRVVQGFMAQFEAMRVALEATLVRAAKERLDVILDGVHVLPSELDLERLARQTVVVPVVLVVTTKGQLARQLSRRSLSQPERKPSRYLRNLDEIWDLQSHLLALAEAKGIPTVCNWNIEDSVAGILQETSRRVCARFPADPGVLD